jgi:hypothetical protein
MILVFLKNQPGLLPVGGKGDKAERRLRFCLLFFAGFWVLFFVVCGVCLSR